MGKATVVSRAYTVVDTAGLDNKTSDRAGTSKGSSTRGSTGGSQPAGLGEPRVQAADVLHGS